MRPRTCARYTASRYSATSCDVNAFVEATPISGPACVYTVPSASRVAMLPTTLQIAMDRAPFFRASRSAASVSAVSPDCVITTASVRLSTIGIAVAVLRAVVHFGMEAGQLLDHVLADQTRVP